MFGKSVFLFLCLLFILAPAFNLAVVYYIYLVKRLRTGFKVINRNCAKLVI